MLQKAISWIHNHHLQNAVPITNRQKKPYPEVTGYYIPTLLSIGEIELAEQFSRWLVTVQNKDGSFSLDNPNVAYVFDTGQVIRGWVKMVDRLPELRLPLERACRWIIQGADPVTGKFMHPAPGGDWSLGPRGEVNEGIHLYVIQPLREAANKLQMPDIHQAADKALAAYLRDDNIIRFDLPNALTHFYAYMQEALVEVGCLEEARRGMAAIAPYQQANGAVPGYYDVKWICSTGLAQLAKVWYLLGDIKRADLAMSFLAQLQNESGGFYGSYGVDTTYFPQDEISWAVKYTIDAEHLRIASHFNQTVHQYSMQIEPHDGRVQTILNATSNAKRVLDAGCGKGRYAALVKQQQPACDVHAVDVSLEMLKHVPAGIQTQQSSIQDLSYADQYFDVVFCIEALEHAPNPNAAIREMTRVLAPGGCLIIIDKNKAHLGCLQIEAWEKWFDVDELTQCMQAAGLSVNANYVSYDNHQADGLFVAWIGKKNVRNTL